MSLPPPSNPSGATPDPAIKKRLRAASAGISLGMAAIAAMWLSAGVSGSGSSGSSPMAHSLGWAMLALALLPLGAWAKTPKGSLAWAALSLAATIAAVIIPLAT